MTNSSAVWSPCTRSVHNPISKLAESRVRQRFGEHVGDIIGGSYIGYADATFFDEFANEEVAALHVFHPTKVLGIVSDVDGAFVITLEGDRRADRYGIT